MKKLLFPLLFALVFSTSAVATVSGPLAVKLLICNTTTSEDLQQMQKFMEANGYTLQIVEAVYDEQGNLQSVKGAVDFGKSAGSFEAFDLNTTTVEIKKGIFGNMKIHMKKVE